MTEYFDASSSSLFASTEEPHRQKSTLLVDTSIARRSQKRKASFIENDTDEPIEASRPLGSTTDASTLLNTFSERPKHVHFHFTNTSPMPTPKPPSLPPPTQEQSRRFRLIKDESHPLTVASNGSSSSAAAAAPTAAAAAATAATPPAATPETTTQRDTFAKLYASTFSTPSTHRHAVAAALRRRSSPSFIRTATTTAASGTNDPSASRTVPSHPRAASFSVAQPSDYYHESNSRSSSFTPDVKKDHLPPRFLHHHRDSFFFLSETRPTSTATPPSPRVVVGPRFTIYDWQTLERFYIGAQRDIDAAARLFYNYVSLLRTPHPHPPTPTTQVPMDEPEKEENPWPLETIRWRCQCLDTFSRYKAGYLPGFNNHKRQRVLP